ncbi:MAG: porin [Candidatus Pelagibacter sp.]
MNKFKKIGVSALAGSLMAVSANALEMSVSGGASITFADYGGDVTNNAFSSGDGLTFSASGETDGGLTITSSLVLDNGVNDDQSVSIATADMGTITFHAKDGSSALGAVDDVMPTAYEEPWFGVTAPTKVDGKSGNGMWQYTSASMGGATLTATYLPSLAAVANSQTSIAIAYSPEMVDGLTVGYASQEDDSTAGAANQVDDTTMYAKYVFGSITAGVQQSEGDSNTDASDTESLGIGVSYAVSDEMSISYGQHTVEFPNDSTKSDQESSAVSVSYTSGGMTVAGSIGSVDNLNGSTAAANDKDTYEFSMSFAF